VISSTVQRVVLMVKPADVDRWSLKSHFLGQSWLIFAVKKPLFRTILCRSFPGPPSGLSTHYLGPTYPTTPIVCHIDLASLPPSSFPSFILTHLLLARTPIPIPLARNSKATLSRASSHSRRPSYQLRAHDLAGPCGIQYLETCMKPYPRLF
jgi:hypothetical protein